MRLLVHAVNICVGQPVKQRQGDAGRTGHFFGCVGLALLTTAGPFGGCTERGGLLVAFTGFRRV